MLDHVHDVKFTSGRGDDYIYTAAISTGTTLLSQRSQRGVVMELPPQHHWLGMSRPSFQIFGSGFWLESRRVCRAFLEVPNVMIRLGDVLVGLGQNESTGIMNYGFGKETAEEFHLTGAEAKTAMLVSAAIGAIKLKGPDQWSVFRLYYESIRDKEHNDNGTFADQGQDNDHLYVRGRNANDGSPNSVPVPRQRRPLATVGERVKMWYGKIGSGDKLMKNAEKRDELRA
jgi:hypothetical protein